VTLRQISPRRIRLESALPRSNQMVSLLQGPVTMKKASRPTEAATPANKGPETMGSAGGGSGRRFSRA
jgi:hypothetical protein